MTAHRTALAPLAAALLSACSSAARVEVEPATLQLWERGQAGRVRAVALAADGKALPGKECRWSSADPRVAVVSGTRNEATVTAIGQGSTAVRCGAGGASGELAVSVRLLGRVAAGPDPLLLRLGDQPAPVALQLQAFDVAGAPAPPHRLGVRCADEGVCRGDERGQVWPVGPGATTATVTADGVSSQVAVRVEDARTPAGRPRAVQGDPMAPYRRAAPALLEQARRARGAGR